MENWIWSLDSVSLSSSNNVHWTSCQLCFMLSITWLIQRVIGKKQLTTGYQGLCSCEQCAQAFTRLFSHDLIEIVRHAADEVQGRWKEVLKWKGTRLGVHSECLNCCCFLLQLRCKHVESELASPRLTLSSFGRKVSENATHQGTHHQAGYLVSPLLGPLLRCTLTTFFSTCTG